MGIIDKIFTFKGNRQFSEAEDELINILNEKEDFIADEAFINYTHTSLFAIDKEEGKLLAIRKIEDRFLANEIKFEEILNYSVSIKDRIDEEWMDNFNKWKKNKKYIKSIILTINTLDDVNFDLDFFNSENKEGSKVSSVPVKRAFYSLDIWDKVLYSIIEKENQND